MEAKDLIPILRLCTHYELEAAFFERLHEEGLIEVIVVEESGYLHPDAIGDLERMIRIHRDLHVNIEGIDVVFNLLGKVEALEEELTNMRNRLRLYENN